MSSDVKQTNRTIYMNRLRIFLGSRSHELTIQLNLKLFSSKMMLFFVVLMLYLCLLCCQSSNPSHSVHSLSFQKGWSPSKYHLLPKIEHVFALVADKCCSSQCQLCILWPFFFSERVVNQTQSVHPDVVHCPLSVGCSWSLVLDLKILWWVGCH